MRHAARSKIVIGGRRMAIDPATVVCWGVGTSERRGGVRAWRRFDCIAPTFRGVRAGPDVLFVLQPTGKDTFARLNTRFSRY